MTVLNIYCRWKGGEMSFDINRLESLQNYHWMYPETKKVIKCIDCDNVLDDENQEYCEDCLEYKEFVNEHEKKES
jgi:hypothetical protein